MKEPWEMTKAEWDKAYSHEEMAKIRAAKGPAGVAYAKGRLEYGIDDTWIPDILKSGKPSKVHGHFDENKHPLIVKKALSQGKPVPPEVLADYPELVNQSSKDFASLPLTEKERLDTESWESARHKAMKLPEWTRLENEDNEWRKSHTGILGSSPARDQLIGLIYDYLPDEQTRVYNQNNVVRQGVNDSTSNATILMSIHESRSPQSRESDERLTNSLTISPDDPRIEKWKKNPGSMDVEGIDTPKTKYKVSKAKPKSRKHKPGSGLGTTR